MDFEVQACVFHMCVHCLQECFGSDEDPGQTPPADSQAQQQFRRLMMYIGHMSPFTKWFARCVV